MGTRMLARRTFERNISAGVDRVLAGIWLPAKTRVASVRGYSANHVVAPQPIGTASMASIEGWVLPVIDPDATATMEVHWDTHVPKDTFVDVLDLDTVAQDTSPFFEPGEVYWESIFDIGVQPRRLYHHHWMSTFAHNAVAQNRDPESPFLYEYTPGNTVAFGTGPFSVMGPSLLVFGGASPNMDRTSTSIALAALAEEDWGQLQFIDHVLERAQLHLLGLFEAGAETPFEEASALLRSYLDPSVLEETGGVFLPLTWKMLGEYLMGCCNTGLALKEEYTNALRWEALSYARLIAHKHRHDKVEEIPAVRHMHLVNEAAKRYAEGVVNTHRKVPPS